MFFIVILLCFVHKVTRNIKMITIRKIIIILFFYKLLVVLIIIIIIIIIW